MNTNENAWIYRRSVYIAASGSAAAVQVVPQQLQRAAAPPWTQFCITVCRHCWFFHLKFSESGNKRVEADHLDQEGASHSLFTEGLCEMA